MKICTFSRVMPAHSKGGMQDHVLMLAEQLAEKGNPVEVITTGLPEGGKCEIRKNLRIHYLEGTIPGSYSGGWWEKSLNKFEELHKEINFDICHSQSAGGYAFLRKKYNKKYNIPVVVSFHGTTYDEIRTQMNLFSLKPVNVVRPVFSILHKMFGYLFSELPYVRSADGIIATSNEQAKLIEHLFLMERKKIFKVFNGIDVNIFKPEKTDKIRPVSNILPTSNFVLSLARLERDKGIQNIIKAMPLILKELPDTKLMIVGDGSFAQELKKMVLKSHLENNVIFTGMLPFYVLPDYFNSCDLFVNPTIRQNGYDLTILEAMACEKPVVVSNIGSVPTAVNDGVDGLLVPPGNIKMLAVAVTTILKDKMLADRLGISARKKIVEGFSVESMVNGTLKVFEEIIGRRMKEQHNVQ